MHLFIFGITLEIITHPYRTLFYGTILGVVSHPYKRTRQVLAILTQIEKIPHFLYIPTTLAHIVDTEPVTSVRKKTTDEETSKLWTHPIV